MTRVLVLHNEPQSLPADPAAASEHAIVAHAAAHAEALGRLGYRAEVLALGPDPAFLWTELKRRSPDVILNLYEGTLDDPETETYVAGLLAWSGIPFTGCPVPALTLARSKPSSKRVLKAAGLPTADFRVLDGTSTECDLPMPVFVKPAEQDASVGIDRDSICRDGGQLEARLHRLRETLPGPILVERYLPGREIHVAVTALPALRALPAAEVAFAAGQLGILTYDAKWTPTSADYLATPMRFGIDLPTKLAAELGEIAKSAFVVLGARDYARVDFRLDADDRPFILELNPNPEIGPDACFGRILESAEIEYDVFLRELIEHARSRSSSLAKTIR
jgi:D-alanine-D-alanine ligase